MRPPVDSHVAVGRRYIENSLRLLTFSALLALFVAIALAIPAMAFANTAPPEQSGVPMRAETVTVDLTHVRTVSLAEPAEHVAVYWRDNKNASVTVAFSSDGTNFAQPIYVGRDLLGESPENGMTYGAVLIAHGATAVRVTSDRPLAQLTVLGMSDQSSLTLAQVPTMAIQATDQPTVISRQQWGADPAYMTWAPEFYQTRKLIVHHTAGSNDYKDRAEAESYVRSIYYYHSVTRAWGDIAYNFLIDKFGNVYEGRYSRDYAGANPTGDGPVAPWSVTPSASFPVGVTGDFGGVRGGHTYGWNGGTMGVSVLGTYTTETISPAARAALVQLLAWEAARNGIEPLATETFTDPVFFATITTPNIGGHRLYVATECPGEAFNADLPSIREEVAAQITPPAPDTTPPTVTTKSPAPGAAEVAPTASVTASFSEAVDPGTVDTGTMTLVGPGSTQIAATVTYDAALRTAKLQPVAPLTPSTSYTATVLGGAGGSEGPRWQCAPRG